MRLAAGLLADRQALTHAPNPGVEELVALVAERGIAPSVAGRPTLAVMREGASASVFRLKIPPTLLMLSALSTSGQTAPTALVARQVTHARSAATTTLSPGPAFLGLTLGRLAIARGLTAFLA